MPQRSGSTEAVGHPSLTDTQKRILIALCRPLSDGSPYTAPATNQQIAGEVFLSVDAVKGHLRALYEKFELTPLPQNQKRARLAEIALRDGLVASEEPGLVPPAPRPSQRRPRPRTAFAALGVLAIARHACPRRRLRWTARLVAACDRPGAATGGRG